MLNRVHFAVILFLFCFVESKYSPDWKSLDSRPLPSWYDEAKVGIFIHWGVFSVPAFGSEWFWQDWTLKQKPFMNFMEKNFKPNFTYPEFGPLFTAEFYDPDKWAEIFEASGAKYVVLTSKHHEGFTLWPSKVSWNWNAKDIGPKRDILGDLAKAIRSKTDIHFGVYHSLFEWFHPLYLLDEKNNYATQYFVENKALPELFELVNNYRPEVIWSDGDWVANDTYWKSTEFLAWLYNDSPVKDVVAVNDRWGYLIPCNHGGYYTCSDRFNPKTLQTHKWENAMTLDKGSWGFRRNVALSDYLTIEELVTTLAETVSCGGNLLINVGPTHDGRIIPIFEERLRQFGDWMKINGEAIYATKPWTFQNDTITPGVWFTSKGDDVYAIVLSWPKNNVLLLGAVEASPDTKIYMLGVTKPLKYTQIKKILNVSFPVLPPNQLPSNVAWVLKITK